MNGEDYIHHLIDKCREKGVPYTASFELTPFCNFRCNMCYIRLDPKVAEKQGKMLTTEQWIRLGEDAKKMGVFSLEVTGGEPTTRPDFPVLYKAFAEMGYFIILRSNGYLLDKKMIEFFKQFPPREISVTLYGASDETYEKVCGVKDGFTIVSRNLIAMKEAGLPVRTTSTLTKDNIEDFEPMKVWTKQNRLPFHATSLLFTPIRGAKRSIEHLKVIRRTDEDENLQEAPADREIPNRDKYMNPFWMCRHFGIRFSISWDGRMTLCNSFCAIWQDPFETSLEDAFQSMNDELKALKRPKECETCSVVDLCLECPAAIYSESSSLDRANEKVCRSIRSHYQILIERKEKEEKKEKAKEPEQDPVC